MGPRVPRKPSLKSNLTLRRVIGRDSLRVQLRVEGEPQSASPARPDGHP